VQLFAAETRDPDSGLPTVILVAAGTESQAVAAAVDRTGYMPVAMWRLQGAQRRLVDLERVRSDTD
jgi:hypothetical protein